MARFVGRFEEEHKAISEKPEYKAEKAANEIAMKINEKMSEQRMNQVQLAKKLKVSKAYVSQILQGNNNMTLLTMYKIASALSIDLNFSFDKDSPVLNPCEGNIIDYGSYTSKTSSKEKEKTEDFNEFANAEVAEPPATYVASTN